LAFIPCLAGGRCVLTGRSNHGAALGLSVNTCWAVPSSRTCRDTSAATLCRRHATDEKHAVYYVRRNSLKCDRTNERNYACNSIGLCRASRKRRAAAKIREKAVDTPTVLRVSSVLNPSTSVLQIRRVVMGADNLRACPTPQLLLP